MQNSWFIEAQKFLTIKDQFKLGDLSTEKQNPDTIGLAQISQTDLKLALETFHQVDRKALNAFMAKKEILLPLATTINDTLRDGDKVFFVGCGATGRLALSIEFLAHALQIEGHERVFGMMSGGDLALIHSIEKFEDYPEYAHRQLQDLNFAGNDLVIAVTEGGETPFVIGAAQYAVEHSKRKPFFMYCNPDAVLIKVAERSKLVLEDDRIHKINLDIGPMALSGSTRLQATTIQMLACSLALFSSKQSTQWESQVQQLIDILPSLTNDDFCELIEIESDIYHKGESVLYKVEPSLAIAVMTDTTERAPTFSLAAFENRQDQIQKWSWCYLYDEDSTTAEMAWEKLLLRTPRTLEWPELEGIAGAKRLYGFDFSHSLRDFREKKLGFTQHLAVIEMTHQQLAMRLGRGKAVCDMTKLQLWQRHLVLKMILNAHSTLVMGRLQRYQSNIMTYVKASNNKLIDRATRYILLLLKEKGREDISYDEVVMKIYEVKSQIGPDRPIVLEVLKQF
ncbi:MAG: hypothetical protein COW00_04145 [Bdellovibrio sp. CG12_big_fil_rev_8_21_14_0_65_39_13]|nr:MAG: hypothetical protein COW78_20275 [Bdellovibrio sp. CG22_combo_CG10-13_8_21_14_all_39_27]PIQ61304.1 MAG: hypothetical protein COW00_04145 [Bdellovibrio sp. CG12_big_fil_rev_8_21_14_0_65_39_13]PIR33613.1 MAG: hypothetical protein COV37_15790 [Bdellovibrio sp. CG11_big_fil_rev_8_21_14_0_20_39_38]